MRPDHSIFDVGPDAPFAEHFARYRRTPDAPRRASKGADALSPVLVDIENPHYRRTPDALGTHPDALAGRTTSPRVPVSIHGTRDAVRQVTGRRDRA